jgi:ketosteroid isomerase-like protein
MHPDVCVVFNDGTYYGLSEVQRAFSKSFALIKDERYEISGVRWVSQDGSYAVGMYRFRWSGEIEGRAASGGGRGTCVLKNERGKWLLLAEPGTAPTVRPK